MKQDEPSSFQDLIDALVSPDYRANREASEALVTLGDRAVIALERALEQVPVESQKTFVYFTLKNISSPAATSVLQTWFLKESDELNRSIIAEGLGLARCREAGPILEQALNETQVPKLAWSIRVALAHLGEQDEQYRPYLSWLLEQADHPDESRRIETVRALQTFETEAATSKLLEKLQHDQFSSVKAVAALALTEHNLKRTQKPLEIIAEAGEPEASLFASLALSHLQQVPLSIPVKELKERASSLSPEGRAATIRVLSSFHRPQDGVEVLSLLIDFLATDDKRSVKQAVVRRIDCFKAISVSADAAEAITTLEAMVSEGQKYESSVLAAVALVKLGHLKYLDVVRGYLLEADEFNHELTSFVLNQLNDGLANDIIPLLLDLADQVDEKTRFSLESLLYIRYWRDPRLIPYFRGGLSGLHKMSVFSVAEFLHQRSEEGYEPAYHLLKEFLGEEPSVEAMKRHFPWLPPNYDGSTWTPKTD